MDLGTVDVLPPDLKECLLDLLHVKNGVKDGLFKSLVQPALDAHKAREVGPGPVSLSIVEATGDDHGLLVVLDVDAVPTPQPGAGVQVKDKEAAGEEDGIDALEA